MSNVALNVHLGLFPFGRCGQRDHPKYPRADALGDTLDHAAFSRRVAPLEYYDDLESLVLYPFLELHQFDMKLGEFFFDRVS